ncbi:MAG: SDR family NAD(P)-dependent oxidoreductase [Phycisphaera sp.]|nr:SDR family NAD(P)-dependent oxidoreductase [Phycisphaera sp.]
MSKTYLVTGGSGFIGAALVRRLIAEGHAVRVIDNLARGHVRRLGEVINAVEFIEGDIRDARAVDKATKGVDSVIHCAFINGTEFFYKYPELVLDVGVRGMLNVLDACLEHEVGELVLASSSEVYQTPPTVPTDESAPLVVPDVMNPRYSYGGGKIISELLAINYARKHLDRMVIFRPHNVYGPDMGWEHVVPQFILRMKGLVDAADADTAAGGNVTSIEFPIRGSGAATRSFVYIDDFTDGLYRVIDRGEHMNIYHIGTMDEVTIVDVAHEVAACFDRKVRIVPGDPVHGETPRRCPDITKLRGLGYEPHVSLADGIARTAEWYIANAELAPTGEYLDADTSKSKQGGAT